MLDFLVSYSYEYIVSIFIRSSKVPYAGEVGVSFLAFNYRGVGRSQGMPEIADDLVTDGQAAMDYLLTQGVASKGISFFHFFYYFDWLFKLSLLL
jgi:hypothetical protein